MIIILLKIFFSLIWTWVLLLWGTKIKVDGTPLLWLLKEDNRPFITIVKNVLAVLVLIGLLSTVLIPYFLIWMV